MDEKFSRTIKEQEFLVVRKILIDIQKHDTNRDRLERIIVRIQRFQDENPGGPNLVRMTKRYVDKAETKVKRKAEFVEYQKVVDNPQAMWVKASNVYESRVRQRIPKGVKVPCVMHKGQAIVEVFNDWQWRHYFDQGYRL